MAEHQKSDFSKKVEDFARSLEPDIKGKERAIIIVSVDIDEHGGSGTQMAILGKSDNLEVAMAQLIANPDASEIVAKGLMDAAYLQSRREDGTDSTTDNPQKD